MTSTSDIIEIEQRLLGSIVRDNAVLSKLAGLGAADFCEPLHQRIFDAIQSEVKAGRAVDEPLLARKFTEDPDFEEFGGIRFLVELANQGAPFLAPSHAEEIRNAATIRSLHRLVSKTLVGVADRRPAIEILELFRGGLEQLERGAALTADLVSASEVADHVSIALADIVNTGKAPGFATGLKCVDGRLGGLAPGRLIVLGGRPGMGKTALARAIAHGCASRNPAHSVVFIGLEMGPDEMLRRELSALTYEIDPFNAVSYSHMERGVLDRADLELISTARQRVPSNLLMSRKMSATVDDVRRAIFAAQVRGRVALVVVDYLQLMQRPAQQGRNDSAVIGEMTAELKRIARQMDVAIMVLSQLSRGVENRDNKRPGLSDLRESGSIEQDADAVLFVFREGYYVERDHLAKARDPLGWEMRCEALRRELEVFCAKIRQGAVGTDLQTIRLEYDHVSDPEVA